MKTFIRTLLLALCASILFLGCNEIDGIDNIDEWAKSVKASQISTINAQMTSIQNSVKNLETVDSELNALISSLREGMTVEDGDDKGMEKVIQKLENADASLKQRIKDLKKYSDNPENRPAEWTATTYTTLEKHNAVLTEIAELNNVLVSELLTTIGELDSSYSKRIAAEKAKLEAEIENLETSLKEWVNEQLSGYYTIAQVEAKLKALEDGYKAGDEALAAEIATLHQALETATAELTSAYQAAIATAITENNGTINQKIAADIKTATDSLQGQIDSLSKRLDAVESRIAALEAAVAKLISMVQSVVVVPDYSDGSVAISRVADNKVRFEVYPLDAAESIAKTGISILSLDYVETITKSSEVFVNLPITAVEFTGKTLLLTVDGTNLPKSVLEGGSSYANARLKISDGTNTRSSEYFPIFKQGSGSTPKSGIAITGESTDISESSAKLFGWCNQSGVEGASVVYGIELSSYDLTTSAITLRASEKDTNNKYYCLANGLSSNTQYYYRAFTLFNGVRTYGDVKTFKTLDFSATVTTMPATSITEFKATLNGELKVDSVEELNKKVWFLYSASASTLEDLKVNGNLAYSSLNQEGGFSRSISTLYNTTYYYVACSKVHDAEYYGEVRSFTTLDFSANVTSADATDITEFYATLNGGLTVVSEEPLSKSVWFLYSDSATDLESLKTNGTKVTSSLQENGSFQCSIPQQSDFYEQSKLNYNTTYHYVACSRVHDKDCFGDVKSFTTKDIIASVTTSGVSNIGFNKGTLSGFLAVENTISLNKTVGFWYGNGTTAEQLKTNGTKVIASLENNGSFSYKITPLSPNCTYHCVAFAIVHDKEFIGEVKAFTTDNIPPGAIDLGLSVGWASWNIGASSPEEYGDSYAWGEIETKTNYEWSTYKFNTSGSDDYGKTVLTKYCTNPEWGEVDGKLTLDPEDDVAHITLGGSWRMPTTSEWRELCEKCSWKWGSLNGIKGFTITSTITGNSIFIPAAGQMWGTHNSEHGSHGAYWSSQQESSFNIRAYFLDFMDGWYDVGGHDKCRGRSIRAVVD